MSRITWAVSGEKRRYYLCSYCELEFGFLDDAYEIEHECDTSKPRYHNRGIKCATSTSKNKSTTSLQMAAQSSILPRANGQLQQACVTADAVVTATTLNTVCVLANQGVMLLW